MGFSDAVKVVREQRRLTKAQLAEKCGLAASYLSRLEAGAYKSPSIETMVSIARGLEMDPRDLLVLGGYVPEDLSKTAKGLAEDQIIRVTQEAMRRLQEIAQDALTGPGNGKGRSEPGAFDSNSLSRKLVDRRELVGLTLNQVARRSRVPLQLVNQLEDGELDYEPAEFHRVLRDGYGLSDQEVKLMRVEMSLHSVLRRQDELSDAQRLMIVDVAVAAIRRETTD